MVVFKSNTCRTCKKVFCCSDCREAHEDSKHPKPKCPLCVKEDLLYRPPKKVEPHNSKFVCHVVFNHLPLRCKLCGDKYASNQDLLDSQPCRWWALQRRRREELERAPCPTIKLPLTPQQPASATLGNGPKKLLLSGEITSLSARLKQDSLDSPPELVCHTSTPVQLCLPGQKPQVQAPCIPHFFLKTPSSSGRRTFDSTDSTCSRSSSTLESRYYTGLERFSISSVQNIVDQTREIQSEAEQSWCSPAPAKKRHSIMKPEGMSRVVELSRSESTEKRVRFSDQCLVPPLPAESNEYGDGDVFFEARETLDDEDVVEDVVGEAIAEAAPEACTACCQYKSPDDLEGNRVSSVRINNNNNEEVEKSQQSVNSSVEENKSSSSRILMMLLVEKTDSKGLSSMDLAPLINSGLKKLEQSVGSANNSRSDRESPESNCSSSSSKFTAEVLEVASKSSADERGNLCTSIRDSFVSISDRVECFTTPPRRTREPEAETQQVTPPPEDSVEVYKSDGLFSVMARVVRSALNKLPAVTARNLSREPLPPSRRPPTASVAIASAKVVTTSQIMLQRSTSKRPRDRADSLEEVAQASPREFPGSNGSSPRSEVVSSPAAKRHRGWYRIRAREPIARMRDRQITSPRGASLETQRFQQGTLSVRDTFLPLPSRAHQSTQTED